MEGGLLCAVVVSALFFFGSLPPTPTVGLDGTCLSSFPSLCPYLSLLLIVSPSLVAHGMAWLPDFPRAFLRPFVLPLTSPFSDYRFNLAFYGPHLLSCHRGREGEGGRGRGTNFDCISNAARALSLSLSRFFSSSADIIGRFFSGRYVTEQRTESRRRDICPRRKKGSSKYRRISDRSRCDRASH